MECTWFLFRRGFCRVWAAVWTSVPGKRSFTGLLLGRAGGPCCVLVLLALKQCSCEQINCYTHSVTAEVKEGSLKDSIHTV